MAGIMAASVPRQDLATGWDGDPQSSMETNPTSATSGLELGIGGLNLISSNINSGANIKSRSPVPNSGDSVHSTHSTGTANSNQGESFTSGGSNMSRPPGMSSLPLLVPPIGKSGHSKSSSNSSTAHTATLTPTSSIDGGASNDLYVGPGGARSQNSPSSSGDHLPGITNLGSFDTDDGAHDGLMGLQALRERAQSSPGPPPREFSANARGFVPGRPRLPSKDSGRSISVGSTRPPLAGGSAIAPHTVEGMGFQSTGNRSRGASPPPNAGVISRPDSQFLGYGNGGNPSDNSFDSMTLRRALSNDTFGADYNNYGGPRQGNDHLNNSFSQVSLNNQIRGGPSGHVPGLYQSQSQRSLTGGPEYYHEANYEAGFIPHRANANVDADYAMQQQHHQDMNYHSYGPGGHQFQQPRGPHRRSLSLQHNSYSDNDLAGQGSQGVYGMHHRRGSLPHDGQMQRRGAEFDRDFDQRERLGNTSYHRHDNRMVSPAHSPMQSSYGSNHNRYPSDISSASSSSPSLGLGSSAPLYGRHRLAHSDEDISHPLAGENIEVPGEDQYYNDGMTYQRSASMGHAPSYNTDSRHLPTAGASMQAPKNVYNVKFKRTQRTFEIGPRLNRHLEVGTYVKVEADRGEDLGIVIGKAKNPLARSSSFGAGMGDIPTAGAGGGGDLKKIIRLATHDEVQLLGMKRKEEEELLEVCRHKVIQRGMPMVVVDAEYQFDRHKLTFFFEANTRIDFRELVRDLFSIYKTRIWMQQLDKSTSATCPTAPAPAPLVMDYGTPIIAPVSEYEGYAQTPAVGSDDGKE